MTCPGPGQPPGIARPPHCCPEGSRRFAGGLKAHISSQSHPVGRHGRSRYQPGRSPVAECYSQRVLPGASDPSNPCHVGPLSSGCDSRPSHSLPFQKAGGTRHEPDRRADMLPHPEPLSRSLLNGTDRTALMWTVQPRVKARSWHAPAQTAEERPGTAQDSGKPAN